MPEDLSKILPDLFGVRTAILVKVQNIIENSASYIQGRIKGKERRTEYEVWLSEVIGLARWLTGYLINKPKYKKDYKNSIDNINKIIEKLSKPSFEELDKITNDLFLIIYDLGITQIQNEYPDPNTAFVRHIRGGKWGN